MKWFYAANAEQTGPISTEELDQLLANGLITDATLVWREGMTGWQPLREVRQPPIANIAESSPPVLTSGPDAAPEPPTEGIRCHECGGLFSETDIIRFGPTPVCAGCKARYLQRMVEGGPSARPTGGRSAQEILAARFEVNIGRHWDRAWEAFRRRPGLSIGATLLGYFIIMLASAIPLVSIVAPMLVQGPIFGGMLLVALGILRNQPVELGNLFDGFRRRFWQLVVAQLIQGLIIAALIVPMVIVGVAPVFVAFFKAQASGAAPGAALAAGAIAWAVVVGLAAAAISMVLGALWMFALPLIADRGLAFWPALELSRKLAWRNFGGLFLFVLVIALMNIAGMLLLCVGALISMPLSTLMLASLFDELCGDLDPAKA